jgi:hypothetical protein
MSISQCWINTELERAKFLRNDLGYEETEEAFPRGTKDITQEQPLSEGILPDMFKTKPNLDREGLEPTDHTSLNSFNRTLKLTENGSEPAGWSTSQIENIPLRDRDCTDEKDGVMWWECHWEGMDGIGGTNKKGRRCFDKVRISWRGVTPE